MNSLDRGETLDELYSSAWSRHADGPVPSIADFLAGHPGAPTSERLDVLLADQVFRWSRGVPKPLGEYLAEQPSLADEPEAILKLVQGEFLARLETGETPDPDSYARTFPRLAHEIRLQCEVDRWLTMPVPPRPLMSMATTADYGIGHDASGPAPVSQVPADRDAPLVEADFELVRPLGSGGMGEVYEAIQKSLRKRVALKLIRREALDSPSRVRRFFVEARALARLRHPHIVGVHGIGRMADGRYFLVMDLVEGGTTLAALLREDPVSFNRAAWLVATVAEAIEHAHSRGVVHRDLKPSNVLLDAEGRPHVTDFGLAKVFDLVDPDHPPTTADQILGTPHYMTPEQADRTRGSITPRTDVYALGGILYALLTGKPPIQGDSLTAILTQVVSPVPVLTPRVWRGDMPAALERICGTCLEKDAVKRYPSAGAVAAALRAWLANPEIEDSTSVAARQKERSPKSIEEPAAGRARAGWIPDRSLKAGRPTSNSGRWAPKAARTAGARRRMWAAGVGLSTLAFLFMTVTLVQTRFLHKDAREPRVEVPPAPSPLREIKFAKGEDQSEIGENVGIAAAQDDPEKVLKKHGLRLEGSTYVLEGEAEARGKATEMRRLQDELKMALRQQKAAVSPESRQQTIHDLIDEIDQCRIQMRNADEAMRRIPRYGNNAFGNPADAERYFALRDSRNYAQVYVDMASECLKWFRRAPFDPGEKASADAMVSKCRDSYEQARVEYSKVVETTDQKYKELTKDQEIRKALEAIRKKIWARGRELGPSPEFKTTAEAVAKAKNDTAKAEKPKGHVPRPAPVSE